MRKFMTKVGKKFHYGEKGFTLIELLIVIAILGVLAAVVVPNVARFTQSGQKAAAQQEHGTVQTAIDAAMAEAAMTVLTVDIVVGPGLGPNTLAPGVTVEGYLRRAVQGRWQCDVSGGGTDGLISHGHFKSGATGWTYVGGVWTWQADPGAA